MRRVAGIVVAVLLGTMALALCAVGCRKGGQQPNVALIVIDTLRRDHLSAYGYSRRTSPALDALAVRGAAFAGISPTSWTKPATASILTGLHPLRHQAIDRTDVLPSGVETLPERLRAAGYHTVGVSASAWVSARWGFSRGFDSFVEVPTPAGEVAPDATQVNRALRDVLPSPDGPFFLYVHYLDPHAPYSPRITWDGLPVSTRPPGQRAMVLDQMRATQFLSRGNDFLSEAIDLYDGEIRQVDTAVGELLSWLGGKSQRELLIVVTSDHGEEFEEHGRMSHGQTLYREVTDVPLIIAGDPRLGGGLRSGAASLLDVTPTILDAAGVGASDLDGVSLLRQAVDGRPFLLHLDAPDGTSLAEVANGQKLLLARDPYRKELFSLSTDPAEERSILGRPEAGPALRQLSRELATSYNRLRRAAWTREEFIPDAETARTLGALGYLVLAAEEDRARRIPIRIKPADAWPEGRLGWEPDTAGGCLKAADREMRTAFLAGWYPIEAGGRWAAPSATFAVPAPGGARRLVISGASYRTDAAELTVRINDRFAGTANVAKGAGFQAEFALPEGTIVPGEPSVLVRLAVDPAFVPAAHGLHDDRTLGIFVTEACLR